MDPHSRLSQFNYRPPKSGPHLQHSRQMDLKFTSNSPLDGFTKRNTTSTVPTRESSPTVTRPIVTNSRVRQDEKYRKDMYLAFVNNALQKKAEGHGESFDELLNQFNPKKLSGDTTSPPTQVRLWISALSHVVSQLDRQYATLVDAIVSMPWTTMDSIFVKSYIAFIGMLVSARPEYLSRVLEMTTQSLTHQSGLQALNTSFAESSSSPLTRRIVYERLHNLLQHLLSLIPTLPSALQPILVRHFPHKRQNHVVQVTYIRNLLHISEYCPELANRIIGLIIERTIQIDVEIQVELEEIETEGPPDTAEVFPLDLFDNVMGEDGNSDSDSDSEGDDIGGLSDLSSDAGGNDSDNDGPRIDVPLDLQHVQDMAIKLDSILTVVFDYFNRMHSVITSTLISPDSSSPSSPLTSPLPALRPSSPLSVESGKNLRRARFLNLIGIFDRTILRTFKSRYTQFLVFWYASLDPEFSDIFQGFLVQRALLEDSQPAVTRAAAASYIASLVSRAQFIDRMSTRRVVGVLCAFITSQLDVYDVDKSGLSSPLQTVFYAVVQALFLIFCFRWRDLMEDNEYAEDGDLEDFGVVRGGSLGGQKKWMRDLNVMQRVVNSALNPLKVCSPNVVQQFARVAQHVGFVYCYSILEANKRSEYSSSTNTPTYQQPHHQVTTSDPYVLKRHAVVSNPLDADLTTFFPFDPYKLPKSSVYIQGVYREWSAVSIDEEEEDDEEDDDESGEHEDVRAYEEEDRTQRIPFAAPNPHEDLAGGLGKSFGGMSISPIRPREISMET